MVFWAGVVAPPTVCYHPVTPQITHSGRSEDNGREALYTEKDTKAEAQGLFDRRRACQRPSRSSRTLNNSYAKADPELLDSNINPCDQHAGRNSPRRQAAPTDAHLGSDERRVVERLDKVAPPVFEVLIDVGVIVAIAAAHDSRRTERQQRAVHLSSDCGEVLVLLVAQPKHAKRDVLLRQDTASEGLNASWRVQALGSVRARTLL